MIRIALMSIHRVALYLYMCVMMFATRFLYRVATSWDYGWQQKQAIQLARDVNHGRCFVLRHTFYRKNNLAPDPPHYARPSGGQISICSEYSCNFN